MATLTAGTVSSAVALTTLGDDYQVIICNDGPSDVHVKIGTTATMTDPRVLAGNSIALSVSATDANPGVAAITASGTAKLRISSPGITGSNAIGEAADGTGFAAVGSFGFAAGTSS
jgi:hypothetical protein